MQHSELLSGLLTMLEKEGGNEFIDKAEIIAKYKATLWRWDLWDGIQILVERPKTKE